MADFSINAQMIVNGARFTPASLRERNRGKPVPIRPKSGIMSLDIDGNARASPTSPTSPKSLADAPEASELEEAGDESIDEDAIKETPPRPKSSGSHIPGLPGHVRQGSEPRPLGEVMDEVERAGSASPTLRHPRGRLEEQRSSESNISGGSAHRLDRVSEGSDEHSGSPKAIRRKAVPSPPKVDETYAEAVKAHPPAPTGENAVAEGGRGQESHANATRDQAPRSDGAVEASNGSVENSAEAVKDHAPAAADDVTEDKGRVESYAEAVKVHAPATDNAVTEGNGVPISPVPLSLHTNGSANAAKHVMDRETYEAVGEDESPRSPVRKAHKRMSSRSLNGTPKKEQKETSQSSPSEGKSDQQQSNGKAHPGEEVVSPKTQPSFGGLDGSFDEQHQEEGSLVYEPIRNKSGENLVSIKPSSDYDLSLRAADSENRQAFSAPPGDELEMKRPEKQQQLQQQERRDSLTSGRRAGAGWSTSAIRWAPLNVPLQRRLQTLMVLVHTLSIAGSLAFFFLLCTIPILWPILLPYLLYVLLSRASIDGKLSYRSEWLRSSKVWSLFAGYFPARLHRSEALEPGRKYVFGYHPHGIISHGAFAAFATEALGFKQLFPGITNTLLTLDSNFRIPLYRDYALRMGLASVSRESCENILSHGGPNGEGMGRAITIVIGGARESLDAKPYTLRLVLKRRKGFVKLAIRTGADLVPVLAFGENDIYEQFDASAHPYVHKAQLMVKKVMGFTVPLFHARGVFNYDVGLMPYRRPINIVVGKPIRVQQQKNPYPKYVDQIHERYVDELMRIWDDWKDVFARHREGELEVIE